MKIIMKLAAGAVGVGAIVAIAVPAGSRTAPRGAAPAAQFVGLVNGSSESVNVAVGGCHPADTSANAMSRPVTMSSAVGRPDPAKTTPARLRYVVNAWFGYDFGSANEVHLASLRFNDYDTAQTVTLALRCNAPLDVRFTPVGGPVGGGQRMAAHPSAHSSPEIEPFCLGHKLVPALPPSVLPCIEDETDR